MTKLSIDILPGQIVADSHHIHLTFFLRYQVGGCIQEKTYKLIACMIGLSKPPQQAYQQYWGQTMFPMVASHDSFSEY